MATDDPRDDKPEADKTGADKRQHRRVDFHRPVKVVVPDESTAIDVISSNVSKGGIFLRSNNPLPEGQKVSLDIDTDQGKVEVEEGEVKWSKGAETVPVDGMPPGMGVEFQKISPEAEQSIGDLIDEVVGETDPQKSAPVVLAQASEDSDSSQTASPAVPVDLPPDPQPIVPQPDSSDPTWPPKASMQLSLETKADSALPPAATPGPNPEENMAAFTKPPAPKTRMLIFVGFVLLVAVLTFLTLMWIKPFDEVTDPGAPGAKSQTPTKIDKPPVTDAKPSKTEDKAPAVEDKAPATDDKAPAAEDKAPAVEDKAPAVEDKASSADDKAPAAGLPVLQTPTFDKAGSGWRMEVRTSGAVGFKTFTLKAPPRLVIDVQGSTWSGPGEVNSPAPFVSRIRFGKQPADTIRLVLDFTSGKVPKYAVTKGGDRLTIRFP